LFIAAARVDTLEDHHHHHHHYDDVWPTLRSIDVARARGA